MDPYIPVLLAFGILVLLCAWLPLLLRKLPLSLPIACLLLVQLSLQCQTFRASFEPHLLLGRASYNIKFCLTVL